MAYTVQDFNRDLAEPYAWPGGYPRYFVCNDGEPLSFEAAKDNAAEITRCLAGDGADLLDNWHVVGCDINWEDTDLICAHTNKPIECAYGE